MSARSASVMIAATMLLACCRPPEGREVRDFERMRQQQRYDSYEASAFFHDGAVMQAPPDHTIPISSEVGAAVRPAAFFTGAADSVDAANIPLAVDATLLSRGAAQFAISCQPCHGAAGFGGGVVAPNLTRKRPPSLRTPPVSTLAPGTLFKVITDGFGQMPPYGWQMPPELRWAVVAYVRTLPSRPATTASIADSTLADRLRRLDSATASKRPLAGLAVPPVETAP